MIQSPTPQAILGFSHSSFFSPEIGFASLLRRPNPAPRHGRDPFGSASGVVWDFEGPVGLRTERLGSKTTGKPRVKRRFRVSPYSEIPYYGKTTCFGYGSKGRPLIPRKFNLLSSLVCSCSVPPFDLDEAEVLLGPVAVGAPGVRKGCAILRST